MLENFNITFGQYLLALIMGLFLLTIYYSVQYEIHTEPFIQTNISEKKTNSWNRNKCDYIMNKTLEDELLNVNISYTCSNSNCRTKNKIREKKFRGFIRTQQCRSCLDKKNDKLTKFLFAKDNQNIIICKDINKILTIVGTGVCVN